MYQVYGSKIVTSNTQEKWVYMQYTFMLFAITPLKFGGRWYFPAPVKTLEVSFSSYVHFKWQILYKTDIRVLFLCNSQFPSPFTIKAISCLQLGFQRWRNVVVLLSLRHSFSYSLVVVSDSSVEGWRGKGNRKNCVMRTVLNWLLGFWAWSMFKANSFEGVRISHPYFPCIKWYNLFLQTTHTFLMP